MTGSEVLLVENVDRTAVLTLNRPDAGNALSLELLSALRHALQDADRDDAIEVIVLTGSDPSFCLGLDLSELTSPERRRSMARAVFASSRPWEATVKPVIGAINGPAERGGFELALACDVLIASERASFADTHASLGLVPALGLTALLPQVVGSGLARRLSLTGKPLTAAGALASGLVTEVVPHGALLQAATALAGSIARNPAPAVRAVVATYRAAEAEALAPALRIELEAHRAHLEGGERDEVADVVLETVLELRRDELGTRRRAARTSASSSPARGRGSSARPIDEVVLVARLCLVERVDIVHPGLDKAVEGGLPLCVTRLQRLILVVATHARDVLHGQRPVFSSQ